MKKQQIRVFFLVLGGFFTVGAALPTSSPAETNQGEELFIARCAKCHGFEGEGFSDIYPAIKDSSYLKANVAKLPCIIRDGSKGELSNRESIYDQIMPATKDVSAEEIGALIRFMQQKWSHPVTELDVEKILLDCATNR